MHRYQVEFSDSGSEESLLEDLDPAQGDSNTGPPRCAAGTGGPPHHAGHEPFAAERQPVGSLPTAKRVRTLSPPPENWEFAPEILMADGATACDVATARVFGGGALPNLECVQGVGLNVSRNSLMWCGLTIPFCRSHGRGFCIGISH